MRLRYLTPLLLALAGCNPPQSPHATPVALDTPDAGTFNGTASGQNPAGQFDPANQDPAFGPGTSLPSGAASTPPR